MLGSALYLALAQNAPLAFDKKAAPPVSAVVISRSDVDEIKLASGIAAGRLKADPNRFATLKRGSLEFLVERVLVNGDEERKQVKAIAWLLKSSKSGPVFFKDAPEEVKVGLKSLLGSSSVGMNLANSQFKVVGGVAMSFMGASRKEPPMMIDLQDFTGRVKWRKNPDGSSTTDPAKVASNGVVRSVDEMQPDALYIAFGKLVSPSFQLRVTSELIKAMDEAKRLATRDLAVALNSMGKELCSDNPTLSEWCNQNARRFGDLPNKLQQDYFERTGTPGNPGQTAKDMSGIEVVIEACPVIVFSDGKNSISYFATRVGGG
jgi:hypothetical protein